MSPFVKCGENSPLVSVVNLLPRELSLRDMQTEYVTSLLTQESEICSTTTSGYHCKFSTTATVISHVRFVRTTVTSDMTVIHNTRGVIPFEIVASVEEFVYGVAQAVKIIYEPSLPTFINLARRCEREREGDMGGTHPPMIKQPKCPLRRNGPTQSLTGLAMGLKLSPQMQVINPESGGGGGGV